MTLSNPVTAPRDLLKQGRQLIDIRHLSAGDLEPLLLDETAEWNLELDLDFQHFAALVRDFADKKRLDGVALLEDGELAGYGCTSLDEYKGLITDVYVRPPWRGGNGETALVRVLFDALTGITNVRRVESQLMLASPAVAIMLRHERSVRLFQRLLMRVDAAAPLPPGRTPIAQRFRIDPWTDRLREAAAEVVLQTHAGHVDSQINDQYLTYDGSARLLANVVRFPGFSEAASYAAFEETTGGLTGFVLSTFVAADAAQITELCVTPQARGVGLGYELLRQSIASLRDAGAKRISLCVTATNERAVRLYTQCGFHTVRPFYAYVWDSAQ